MSSSRPLARTARKPARRVYGPVGERRKFLRDPWGDIVICPKCESWQVSEAAGGAGYHCGACGHDWQGEAA
jgi:hypothetical protein